VDEPKTSSSINLCLVCCPTAVTVCYVPSGRALAVPRLAWASQRSPAWAVQLGFGRRGHCGMGLRCSPMEHCIVAISSGLFQIKFISNSV
jgi:hypothetical protein